MSAGDKTSAAQFHHLTDDPQFSLDPSKVPEDNAISLRERTAPGLYMTHGEFGVENWVNSHGYMRPYVAELDVPEHLAHEERWGGERFLPAEHFGEASVKRVIPLDAYTRERYGAHGWIEDRVGTEFDTEKPIPSLSERAKGGSAGIYPYRGYTYSGPDVREMSPEEDARHQERARRAQES